MTQKNNTVVLANILDRFKFTAPVDAAARKGIIGSRKRVLKRSLKALGISSLWFAFVTSLLLKARNIGFKPTVFACKIAAGAACAAIIGATAGASYTYAGYISSAVHSIIKKEETPVKENMITPAETAIENTAAQPDTTAKAPVAETATEKSQTYDIILYNGRVYRGVIISRGDSYRVSTANGEISIPKGQIRKLKRVE